MQVSSKTTGYIDWPIMYSTTYNTNAFSSPSFGGTTTNVAGGYPAVAGFSGSSTYTQFVYSPGGQKIAVVQNGSLVKGTVPLPGGASAIYSSAGLKYLRHKDWLGSSRLSTTWAHAAYSKTAYAPFGENYNQTGTTDLSFTGEDQDTSSGVYDFEFRKYDEIAGRWMSPDPSGLKYASLKVPQSLNLYAYVMNNAMVSTDSEGLDTDCSETNYDASCDTYIPPSVLTEDDWISYLHYDLSQSLDAYTRALANNYWASGNADNCDYWSGACDPGPDSAGSTDSSADNEVACIQNAIPGAINITPIGSVGGHEEFSLSLSGSDLNSNGFMSYTNPFGGPNGYRSVFDSFHLNGQGYQLGSVGQQSLGGIDELQVQIHTDVFNPQAGVASTILHGLVDLGLGTLLNSVLGNFLDGPCQ